MPEAADVVDPDLAALAWLQLQDTAFPAGRFVQSHGLEAWLERHPGAGEAEIAAVAHSFLDHSVATLDAVVLARAWEAAGAARDLRDLDRLLRTYKVAESARTASQRSGAQLARVARQVFGSLTTSEYLDDVLTATVPGNLAVVEGAVHRGLGVARRDTVLGFLRAAHGGFLSAAVRLGRIGPVAGQRLLHAHHGRVAELADLALTAGLDELRSCVPELEVDAMRHETRRARLFAT